MSLLDMLINLIMWRLFGNLNNQSIDKKTNISSNSDTNIRNDNYNEITNKYNNEKKSKHNFIGPLQINGNGFNNKNEPILDFMGIKLYLDDLIILSLLLFLYQEDVKDELLFILLILLLIS